MHFFLLQNTKDDILLVINQFWFPFKLIVWTKNEKKNNNRSKWELKPFEYQH